MEQGVLESLPDAHVIKHPISDGGEGLVSVVTPVLGGRFVTTNVSGPLPGQRVDTRWGLSADGSVAIIEMAEAAGLTLVPAHRRDPKITTTYRRWRAHSGITRCRCCIYHDWYRRERNE